MEINKLTEKYTFTKEGADYILDLGEIKRYEDRSTTLVISGVEDSNSLTIHPQCGCTSTERVLVDKNTLSIVINYKDCDPTFAKIVKVEYKNVAVGLIKIKGKCK